MSLASSKTTTELRAKHNGEILITSITRSKDVARAAVPGRSAANIQYLIPPPPSPLADTSKSSRTLAARNFLYRPRKLYSQLLLQLYRLRHDNRPRGRKIEAYNCKHAANYPNYETMIEAAGAAPTSIRSKTPSQTWTAISKVGCFKVNDIEIAQYLAIFPSMTLHCVY
jgi:hypothetical protein